MGAELEPDELPNDGAEFPEDGVAVAGAGEKLGAASRDGADAGLALVTLPNDEVGLPDDGAVVAGDELVLGAAD